MDCNVIIIGAGVVGLAVARAAAEKFDGVYLVEKNNSFGQEISSRNSEVIHSGIYYPNNSLKSKLCVSGRTLLYRYCEKKKIPYKKTGKLVIAHDENGLNSLKEIQINALGNCVESVLLDSVEISSLEPNISAKYALYFKESGIIDSHSLMKSLEFDILLCGANIAYKNEVVGIEKLPKGGYVVNLKDSNNQQYEVSSAVVINCAGLNSYHISSLVGITESSYQLSYWKGEYFWLSNNPNTRIKSLIYPTPEKNIAGLGIHTTIDISGRVKLGPNAIYLGEERNFNYSVDISNKGVFYKAAKKYLPGLKMEDLNPDQSGIRPKLQKPGEEFCDFVINNEYNKGFENFINLIGIESPGLTSSLSIGQHVVELIDDRRL
jgi:L-2-hydroxyglutarate oxidase LhgO